MGASTLAAAAVDVLRGAGIPLEAGLKTAQLRRVEQAHGFRFSAVHWAFLRTALPVGAAWPDWRDPDTVSLRDALARPVEGLLEAVGRGTFWADGWARRPAMDAEAVMAARYRLMAVPRLLPLRAGRYLAAGQQPSTAPVFAVDGPQVRYAGADLLHWARREFAAAGDPEETPGENRISFWSDLAEGRRVEHR